MKLIRDITACIVIISLSVFSYGCGSNGANLQIKSIESTEPGIPGLFQRKGALAASAEWSKTQQKVSELTNKIAANPKDVKPRLQMAAIYIAEARITGEHPYYYPAIHKILDGVLAIDPRNFEANILKASVYMSQHQFAEAKQLSEKAGNINPSNAYVYGVLVDANVELGNYKEAIAASDKMQSIKPSLESYSRASYLREIFGDYNGAIEAMKLAVEAGLPGSEPQCWSRNTLGDIYLKTGQLNMAEEQYKMNLALRPTYAFSMAGLAKLAVKKKNYDQALQYLDSAVAILPEFSFHEQMAGIYMLQGHKEKAMAKYNEVISMLKEDEASGHFVALEMARLYVHANDWNNAEKYAMMEYAARPANIDVASELAWIYFKKGDKEAAKKYIAIAKSTNSKDPEMLSRIKMIERE
jgi:tetratricopeptide (TPR) repeat protein